MAAKLIGFLIQCRGIYGGQGYIAGELPTGIVTVNSVASGREVEVRHHDSRTVVAVVFSNSDGTYRINDLDPNTEYDVIGRDWSRVYNDYIAARVKPHPY